MCRMSTPRFWDIAARPRKNKSGFYWYKVGDEFGENAGYGKDEGTSRDAT